MTTHLRKPNPGYDGKNGFRDPVVAPDDVDHPDDITLRHVRLAQYVLANKGTYAPSPDTLRQLGKAKTRPVETVESITERIKQLKKQHATDLENWVRFQASEYRQELMDHRACHDVSAYMDIDDAYPDQVAFKQALEDLDKQMLRMDRFKRDMDDGLSKLRYNYLKTLLQYVQTRNGLKSQDEAVRQKRDAWFPQTIQQYHHITERDVQLRVARFLTASTGEQEKMRDEYGWAYRAVHPLMTVYKSNPSFKSEVTSAVSGLFVSDPRRKKSLADESVFTRFEPVS